MGLDQAGRLLTREELSGLAEVAKESENPLRNYRDSLNAMVEDAAGSLEKKAKRIRIVNDMLPQRVTKEQFEAMLQLISCMR